MPTQNGSPVSVFLTNLRLLDFDYVEDWPAIAANLFVAKNARANQKQRIRCVEWALYRLFELWNSKDTKNKLQPFFPPYDALRSINLRAALYRSLNELKKNGILGKEVVVRKTMFDECRGEKFEELLASFSTTVLQDQLRKRSYTIKSVAGRLATSRELSGQAQRSALPLAIAHQRALRALLRRKEQLRERYARLEDTLRAKELELLKRVDDLAQEDQAYPLDAVPDRKVQIIRQQLDKSWQGDTSWVKGIVEGDRRDVGDLLLDNKFLGVWAHAENGTIDNIETTGQSLLQGLSCRIREQQSRLRHWQNVQKDLIGSRPRSPIKAKEKTTPHRSKGVLSPLKFGQMEQNGTKDSSEHAAVSSELKAEHCRLVKRFGGDTYDAGLQGYMTPTKGSTYRNASSSATNPPHKHGSRLLTIDALPSTPGRETASNASCSEQELDSTMYSQHEQVVNPADLESTRTPGPMAYVSGSTVEQRTPSVYNGRTEWDGHTVPQDDLGIHGSSHAGQGQCTSEDIDSNSSPVVGLIPTHKEDEIAQQIISSAMDAGASPMKHKISLMERTRQSIAFARPESFLPDTCDRSELAHSTEKNHVDRIEYTALGRTSSLLERTRRSISLLPPSDTSSRGTRNSIQNRRQLKPYPRNQFETPRKQLEGLKEMTPPEVLFSPEADYASVFKSRPRVGTSSSISPVLAKTLQWEHGGDPNKAVSVPER
ncbi:MAG: hypothetical protein LQ343_003072 [Gyalolechia ehrenbergii]|nr:MAG: hypothetical protein LQ343_003072 [Gyalolechia ehrenbergii]